MYEKVPEQGEYSYIAGMRVSLTLYGYAANDYYDGPEPVWGLIHDSERKDCCFIRVCVCSIVIFAYVLTHIVDSY